MPSKSAREFTSTPLPVYGRPSSSPSFGAITWRIGRSNAFANAWSRSSCAGTAMIAPVPYSIST